MKLFCSSGQISVRFIFENAQPKFIHLSLGGPFMSEKKVHDVEVAVFGKKKDAIAKSTDYFESF